MDRFTARNALLTGVELIRRRPLLVLLWAVVMLVQAFAFAAAAQELAAIARAGIFSGRSVTSYNGQVLALTVANLALSLVVAAVLWSSAFRAILRPVERRPLGFGAEELSVLAVWLITQVVAAAVTNLLQLVVISRFGLVNARPFVDLYLAIEALGLFWSAVAAVWAFGRGQVAPLRCWTIARGRFWLLAALVIGVAVLRDLASTGVQELVRVLAFRLPPLFAHPPLPFAPPPGPPNLGSMFEVPALVRDVLGAVIQALQIAFIAGIVASAYRASPPEPQASRVSGSAAPAR